MRLKSSINKIQDGTFVYLEKKKKEVRKIN